MESLIRGERLKVESISPGLLHVVRKAIDFDRVISYDSTRKQRGKVKDYSDLSFRNWFYRSSAIVAYLRARFMHTLTREMSNSKIRRP